MLGFAGEDACPGGAPGFGKGRSPASTMVAASLLLRLFEGGRREDSAAAYGRRAMAAINVGARAKRCRALAARSQLNRRRRSFVDFHLTQSLQKLFTAFLQLFSLHYSTFKYFSLPIKHYVVLLNIDEIFNDKLFLRSHIYNFKIYFFKINRDQK